ncbi:MAG: YbhB/YbcL family Raf kinase inhibitor-like protein [Rickettsiales bacterium]|nr:YbhB/YbcL family Raf kinase inhibitor-like protein [Rickettsiales bacterium]
MKKIFFLILYILLISPLNAKTEIDKAFKKRDSNELADKTFVLYSPDIYKNQQIREDQVFNGFDCNGQNISPKLVWRNAPIETKSFAITMFNKDAKTDSGWWHWIVYNIPANVNEIEEEASTKKKLLPKGAIQGINDYGMKQYGGVCPPKGEKYNYVITIYALNIEKLNLPKNPTPAMIRLSLNDYKIGTSTIHAFYKRYDENEQSLNKQNKKYKLNKVSLNKKSTKNAIIEE